jgi:hypothetical protein
MVLRVILSQSATYVVRPDSNDGIRSRLIVNGPAEKLRPEEALSQILIIAIERLLHNEFQKILASLASREIAALKDCVELGSDSCCSFGTKAGRPFGSGKIPHERSSFLCSTDSSMP